MVRDDALNLFDFGAEVRHLVWVELSRQLGFIDWRENSWQDIQQRIETTAQAVLDARAIEVGATLADLYNPPMR